MFFLCWTWFFSTKVWTFNKSCMAMFHERTENSLYASYGRNSLEMHGSSRYVFWFWSESWGWWIIVLPGMFCKDIWYMHIRVLMCMYICMYRYVYVHIYVVHKCMIKHIYICINVYILTWILALHLFTIYSLFHIIFIPLSGFFLTILLNFTVLKLLSLLRPTQVQWWSRAVWQCSSWREWV